MLVGTREAIVPVTDKFSNARRNTGEDDKEWGPMTNDNEWYTLMNSLWKYQWTKKETELTLELSNLLYEESCGITDIAIKLYILAQWRAITTGREIIDMKVIKSVSKDSLKLLRPALDLIKQGNLKELETKYPDVLISKEKMDEFKNIYIRKMAEQEKSKSNKGVKQQTITEDVQILISDISGWLVQAGIDCEKSINSSEKAINKLGVKTDISILRKEAFLLAAQNSTIEEAASSKNTSKKTKKNKPSGELLETLVDANSNNKNVNDMLKDKGIIKNPKEFLDNAIST